MRTLLGRHREERSGDEQYLSYHDICLTVEDINALKGDWLTDNNISFWEEYLEHEELSKHPGSKIILLRPSITYLILNTQNLSEIIPALPPLSTASHIFLPINDNPNPEIAEGGSHWSLLVVGVHDHVAFHYDSLIYSNETVALKVCKKLEQILDRKLRFMSLPDTPQQENTNDCGMHVCLTMQTLLLKRLLTTTQLDSVDMSLNYRRQDASQGRKEMLKLIERLRSSAIRGQSPDSKSNSPPRIE